MALRSPADTRTGPPVQGRTDPGRMDTRWGAPDVEWDPGVMMGTTWVVYRVTLRGKDRAVSAVCEQAEWDALQLAQPGCHTLVRSGIPSEPEAERLARGPEAATWPWARRSRLP